MSDLILYAAAVDALAECKFVDEVKDWADRAAATQAYAKMAKDKTLEVDAAEIRIRAERRLGEMLAEQKASGGMSTGAKGIGKSAVPAENRTPTLAEVGIDKKLSARAQKTAAIPAAEFEGIVDEWREGVKAEGAKVTAKLDAAGAEWQEKLERKTPPAEPTPEEEHALESVSDDAERMTDLLRDFEAATRIIESDDKTAEAWAEVKTLTLKLEEANRQLDAKSRELAEMTKEARRWKRKAEGQAA